MTNPSNRLPEATTVQIKNLYESGASMREIVAALGFSMGSVHRYLHVHGVTPRPSSNTVEKFWSQCDRTGECWLWTSTVNRKGYGVFNWRNRHVLAHRFSWEATNGPIEAGMLVCHRCDVPGCVRPAHLFVGTHTDNNRDCANKGRHGAHRQRERFQALVNHARSIQQQKRAARRAS